MITIAWCSGCLKIFIIGYLRLIILNYPYLYVSSYTSHDFLEACSGEFPGMVANASLIASFTEANMSANLKEKQN